MEWKVEEWSRLSADSSGATQQRLALRNREFGPKSNRHDTPPTFPIDLRPEVLPPSSSALSLSLHHPALSSPREKENQAFVRTFLGHLSTPPAPYQPFLPWRSPFVPVGNPRLPLRGGKTEEPMKRAWDTYARWCDRERARFSSWKWYWCLMVGGIYIGWEFFSRFVYDDWLFCSKTVLSPIICPI